MLPYINILGKDYATYGILAVIGMAIAIYFGMFYFSKFYDIKKEDVFYSSMFGLIGVGIGAKLLYILTIIPDVIQDFNNIDLKTLISRILQGGFVFYGGLIGGVLGLLVYSKLFKVSFKKLSLILIPTVPLFHFIGRIGCLCAGCCHGMPYDGFGSIIFYNTPYAPTGIPLFPMQIVESICNLIVFIIILVTYKRYKGTYKTIAIYAVTYSIVRFTLEFYRGDMARGILLGLSTSQWISIVLFIVGVILFIRCNKNNKIDSTSNF